MALGGRGVGGGQATSEVRVPDHELRLPCDATSAGQARGFAVECYQQEGVDPETVEVAQLVVSELVTNAVQHGCSTVKVHLWVDDHAVGGNITDEGAGQPTLLQPPLTSTGGRGLGIVAATTSAWGVRAHGEGKTVWFELPRPAAAPWDAERITIDDLPTELQARVRAAASNPSRQVIQRRRAPDGGGDQYEISAITGDRFVHMIMSLRPDGSVAEATEAFRRDEIHRVVTLGADRAAVEVEHGPERRWTTVPVDMAAGLG
jgi:anti-sigma regulatory factor (Ser/Thr protein kinase)